MMPSEMTPCEIGSAGMLVMFLACCYLVDRIRDLQKEIERLAETRKEPQ
jgi:hypothetical protein